MCSRVCWKGELESLQGRITSLLQQKGVEAEGGDSRIHIQHVAGRAVPARMFQDMLAALIQRRRLKIRYHGRRRDEESERVISPQRLTQYRNSWYLDAWCHQADGLRSFALERIRKQTLSDEEATEVRPEVLSAHFDQSYGIFSGPAEHTAELRFTPETARWISDEVWHPDQQGVFRSRRLLAAQAAFWQSRELLMDILRYGADVEILAP